MRKLLVALALCALVAAPIGARVKAAPGQTPDFLAAYFASISVSTSAQTVGQFLPPQKKK